MTQSQSERFRGDLETRVLVCDGAMGTYLESLTERRGLCLDELNLYPDQHETIRSIHRAYQDAGADIIETNTFGANRHKLGRHGLEERVEAINRTGVRLAREAARAETYVAGSVGPLEAAGREDLKESAIEAIFAEQIGFLVDEGVDLLYLETFQDPIESAAALEVAARTGLPIVFQIGGFHEGRTGIGADVRALVQLAESRNADVIGANCRGPFDVYEAVELLARTTNRRISAQPNAGVPQIERGHVVYGITPRRFADELLAAVDLGAVIVGGCCGTTPEHIRALREAVGVRAPVTRPKVVRLPVREKAPGEETAVAPPNPIRRILDRPGRVVSVELRPSRSMAVQELLDGALELASAGADLFDIPDNAGGRVARDAMVAAHLVQKYTKIPAFMHKSATQNNLIAIQSYLLGAWELGIRGVLAVTGDHPNVGDHDKYASPVHDVKSSVELLKLVRTLNGGTLFNGDPVISPPDFVTGCGFNPSGNLRAQRKWLEKKAEAGASFCFSQPIYDRPTLEALKEATEFFPGRVFAGILPLASYRNAVFLNSGKIPGVWVPDDIVRQFEPYASDRDGAARLGMDLCLEFLGETADLMDSLYLILPFGPKAFEIASTIVRTYQQPGAGSRKASG